MIKKTLLTSLLFLLPYSLFAIEEWYEELRIYKKPLDKWIEIAQTETHTEIFYNRILIKRYVNAEFPVELLPHSPDEDPDCYNSYHNQTQSSRAKELIWQEYLRSCLVLQTKILKNRFILFYGPSADGNRVSLYDKKIKKFYHGIMNNVLDVRATNDGRLVFLVRKFGTDCARELFLYNEWSITSIWNECTLRETWGPLVHIDGYRIVPRKIRLTYTPYILSPDGSLLLDKKKKTIITLSL